jgi:hypothetical protein
MLQNYPFYGLKCGVPYLLLMYRPWNEQINSSDESMSFPECPSIGLSVSHDDRRSRGRLPDVFCFTLMNFSSTDTPFNDPNLEPVWHGDRLRTHEE